LYLRVLLDEGHHEARKKVLELLHRESWEDLRGDQTIAEFLLTLQGNPALTNIQFPLTSLGLDFLYNVRRDGNAAHTATKDEVGDAVQRKPLDKKERLSLEELYKFT
jgi:hypothetical protein